MRVAEAKRRLKAVGWMNLYCERSDNGWWACARTPRRPGIPWNELWTHRRPSRAEALADLVARVEQMDGTKRG